MASNTPILDALRASVAAQAKAAGVSDINDDTGSYIDSNYQRGPLGAAYDEVASAATRQFISQLTPEQFKAMQAEGKHIQWEQSYVTSDKTFCVYVADDEAHIAEHAERSGFPATVVTAVSKMIDPTTEKG